MFLVRGVEPRCRHQTGFRRTAPTLPHAGAGSGHGRRAILVHHVLALPLRTGRARPLRRSNAGGPGPGDLLMRRLRPVAGDWARTMVAGYAVVHRDGRSFGLDVSRARITRGLWESTGWGFGDGNERALQTSCTDGTADGMDPPLPRGRLLRDLCSRGEGRDDHRCCVKGGVARVSPQYRYIAARYGETPPLFPAIGLAGLVTAWISYFGNGGEGISDGA